MGVISGLNTLELAGSLLQSGSGEELISDRDRCGLRTPGTLPLSVGVGVGGGRGGAGLSWPWLF